MTKRVFQHQNFTFFKFDGFFLNLWPETTRIVNKWVGIPIPHHILFLGEWGIGESGFYIPRGIEE